MFRFTVFACLALFVAPPAFAETPRQALTDAAFVARDKKVALAKVSAAEAAARAALASRPNDYEASLVRAMAISYRAKLTRSRHDALDAKKRFEALVARNKRDPEAWAALGGWHIGSVASLGGLVARAALGARKAVGFTAIDRAVALGGDRALFKGLAGLLRLELDANDAVGRGLVVAASRAATPTALDRIMQHAAEQMIAVVKTGDKRAIRALAEQLLPLGYVTD